MKCVISKKKFTFTDLKNFQNQDQADFKIINNVKP